MEGTPRRPPDRMGEKHRMVREKAEEWTARSGQVGEDGKEQYAHQRAQEGDDHGQSEGQAVGVLVGLVAQTVGDGDDVAVVGRESSAEEDRAMTRWTMEGAIPN